jgi:hypothetical protein
VCYTETMDPVRAYNLGVDPNEIRITCEAGRYAGKWIAWVPDMTREKLILTESHDVYELCWFRTQIRIFRGELP